MMKTINCIFALWLLVLGHSVAQDEAVVPARPVAEEGRAEIRDSGVSYSRMRRFVVRSKNSDLRRAVLRLADEAYYEFLGLFQKTREDKLESTVTVELIEGQKGRTMETRLISVEGAEEPFYLKLYVYLGNGVNRKSLQLELLKMSLIERALRDADSTDQRVWSVPEWLLQGVVEAIAWKKGLGDRALYETVLNSGLNFPIEELLVKQADEITDPITRMSFRVWSGALVMALLEAEDGKDGEKMARENFESFVRQAIGYQGEMTVLLRQSFPSFNLSSNSLKKTVTLKLANLSRSKITERMTTAQTEQELNRVLYPGVLSGQKLTESEALWNKLSKLPENERAETLQQVSRRLVRLSYRSFGPYHEVMMGYIAILSRPQMAKEKRQNLLVRLATIRERLVKDARRARDVLDWYELNHKNEFGGELKDYIKLRRQLRHSTSQRKDGLSVYLDQANKIYSSSQ